jgi:hypothetical protein
MITLLWALYAKTIPAPARNIEAILLFILFPMSKFYQNNRDINSSFRHTSKICPSAKSVFSNPGQLS